MDSPHKGPIIWTICLLTCLPEVAAERSVELPVTRDAIAPMWRQCNGFGKSNDSIQKAICMKSRWRHQMETFSAGLLCGELNGHRWIPHAKASDAELWCFLWSAPGPTWDAGDLRRHHAHCDVSVMVSKAFHHYMHYNPRFVRSVQVVELIPKFFVNYLMFFLLFGKDVIIHNEHKPFCPCVSWWIVIPWYLMDTILSIQLSQNNMFYQYVDDWQSK